MKSTIIDEKPLPLSLRAVPDTSVIIEGVLSRKIEKKELVVSEIIIHEAVLAELESQANKNKETGFLGLEEIKRLRTLSLEHGFIVSFKGNRPTDFEIKHAKTGEIDSLIRQLAFTESATLVTADRVQSLVAESKGINVILFEFKDEDVVFALDKYFDDSTMSVHIREGCPVRVKKGSPGMWSYSNFSTELLDRDIVKDLAKQVVEEAGARQDGFLESDRKGSTIVQIGNTRVVISRPPFSDGYEMTCVRPIKSMRLADYALSEKLVLRLERGAEGILIAGAPGQGKSTFAQAMAEDYHAKGKVVKTIESPRDMSLPVDISQYSSSQGSSNELQDLFLLSRPDCTVFDEMRSAEDFRLFSDLRLSGIGMVGVIHATRPIDAIHRFVGRFDLGVIPSIIDTVIFIRKGFVEKVLTLSIRVKVPNGMVESDLARPVIAVTDFLSGRLEYEMYKYGDETVLLEVRPEDKTPLQKLASKTVEDEVRAMLPDASVEIVSDRSCIITVPVGERGKMLGDKGHRIEALEKKIGLKIDVVEGEKKIERRSVAGEAVHYEEKPDKKNLVFYVGDENSDNVFDVYIDDEFFISLKSSKKGSVSLSRDNALGKMLQGSLASGRKIEFRRS